MNTWIGMIGFRMGSWIKSKMPFGISKRKPARGSATLLSVRSCTKAGEVQLEIRIPVDLAQVEADPVYLRQILLNLLSNAMKYNKPDGKMLLFVEKSPDGCWIDWKVQDTGISIPENQLGKLFEDFYRVNRVGNKEVSEIEGTGLGLAYIKRLVTLHKGEILVESAVRGCFGNCIYFKLSFRFIKGSERKSCPSRNSKSKARK